MVRSTCKVVVRVKPKDDPLDTAVQCIDNTAVCVFSVMCRAVITSAIAFTSPKRLLCVLQEPTLLVRKGADDDGLYQVRKTPTASFERAHLFTMFIRTYCTTKLQRSFSALLSNICWPDFNTRSSHCDRPFVVCAAV